MSENFIGSGWGFPMAVDATGGIALVSHDLEIRQSIELILGTAIGERPMRPEYGCGIHDHVFDIIDAQVAGQIVREVRESLIRWEPRIDLLQVSLNLDAADEAVVYIDIRYSTGLRNDPRNLVFPFYVIPSEAE